MSSFYSRFQRWIPGLVLLAGLAAVAASLRSPHNSGPFDIVGFGGLPVLSGGRLKPLDTVARSSLLQLQARQTIYLKSGVQLTPDEWLLDVFFRPEKADAYEIFVIDNNDLLSLLGQTEETVKIKYPDRTRQILATLEFVPSHRRRFAFREIEPHLAEIEAQAKLATPIDDRVRSPFQRAVVQLYGNLVLYRKLQHTVEIPYSDDFLGELLRFQQALPVGVEAVRSKEAGKAHNEDDAGAMIQFGQRYTEFAQSTDILAVPPSSAAGGLNDWKTSGHGILEAFQTGRVDPSSLAYAGLGYAWRSNRPDQFNELLRLFRTDLAKILGNRLRTCDVEVRFNSAQPFYLSMMMYAWVFFLAVFSWLVWPEALRKAALWLAVTAWILATFGIITRMWLEGRPPVTNLYSSALYIGWGAVGLSLVLESLYRNAIPTVAAGVIGFATLQIAHHLALSGDTMEMMRAVLDSNFWLSTHVIAVTTGYFSTFLAGFLALLYIVLGIFTPLLGRISATGDTHGKALERMVYGIICFATLFSFVGTVLGGIWADQSWGRFWGWDPKENGALIIVLWNALILHARWGGLVRPRGLMCLAVFGNIVTSWSWFGVNMLGIGLHSYGFTSAAFYSLSIFVATQLVFIALGNLPLSKWRSFSRTL